MELYPLFMCGLFLVFGIIFMIRGVNLIRLARASASWPKTSGTITISEIKTSSDIEGTTYIPVVKFSYRVNGQVFTGDNIVFDGIDSLSFSQPPYKIISKYYKQKRVEVFYNPSQPNQSVLEPGINKNTFIPFTLGSFLFMIALTFSLLSITHDLLFTFKILSSIFIFFCSLHIGIIIWLLF